MAKGPIEAVEARLRHLESRVGRPVVGRRLRPPRVGMLGPGGLWLQERLNPEHPEGLDRSSKTCLATRCSLMIDGTFERPRSCSISSTMDTSCAWPCSTLDLDAKSMNWVEMNEASL